MNELEIKKYQSLNNVANCGGIVMFGCKDLLDLPLCELKQAFDIHDDLYNRSFEKLTLSEAEDTYQKCIANIKPDTLFIQLGADDIELFKTNKDEFTSLYRHLLSTIKRNDKKCRVAIVSLKNHENDSVVTELNKQLKYIADSEKYEYCDISSKTSSSPKQLKSISSFIYNLGFVHPVESRRQIYDLSRMIFCFE